MLDDIINHIRNRQYMSGVERDAARVKATQEVFTPTTMVNDILDNLDPNLFTDREQTFLDPTCGDGQFLGEVLIRKVENGIDFETALSTIYGVDLMEDNVDLCRERLLCGREDLRHIVEKNIVVHDALTYDFSFNGTNQTQREQIFENFFE
jgi:type I restriction-modification system DNA methylase subunit